MGSLGREAKFILGVLALVAGFAGTVTPGTAGPADPLPTAPIGDVTPGALCEARTVLKGTAIASFEVEILDVVNVEEIASGNLIYFEVTAPDVAAVGVASGMSGSPILCEIGGVQRVVGAIAYGLAGIGPKAFAVPIDNILKGQPSPASFSGSNKTKPPTFRGRELVPLSSPLTVTGVPERSQDSFRRAMKHRGFDSVTFSATSSVDVPAGSADLAPGGAFSINMAYGDVTIGAICTITYRDGEDIWGCGHPLELAGPRSLSFSGAYIFDVVGTPWGSYPPTKLGSPTRTQLGAILYDGPFAVSGKFGRKATTVPVRFTLRPGGQAITLRSSVAFEDGLPGGSPIPGGLTGLMASTMAARAQTSRSGQSTLQYGRICMKQRIVGAGRTVRGCNRFTSSSSSFLAQLELFGLSFSSGAAAPTEFLVGGLESLLEGVQYKALFPGALEVDVNINEGSRLRQIIGLRPVGRLRPGRIARFAVISADRDGRRYRRILRVKVPRKVRAGKGRLRPLRPGRFMFRIESSSYSGGVLDEASLATDNDRYAFRKYAGGAWTGGASIRSPRQLNQAIKGIYGTKARLLLSVPWRSEPVAFPMRGKGWIVTGDARQKARIGRSAGRRSTGSRIR